MDFVKLQKQLEEGKKLSLRYKDGSTVFGHNPPFKLYGLILNAHPETDYWTDKSGANPLFYVDSKKKFDYLVEYGFDLYAKDNDGIGLDDILDVSLFDSLSLKALKKFGGKDEVFRDYLAERTEAGILEEIVAIISEGKVDIEELVAMFPEVEFDAETIAALAAFGGDDLDDKLFNTYLDKLTERDFTFRVLKAMRNGDDLDTLVSDVEFTKEMITSMFEVVGEDTEENLELLGKYFGGSTPSPKLLHQKMIGQIPGEDNTSIYTPHSNDHDWVFTTDARNVYKTYTTKEGYQMLESLADQLEPVLTMLRNTPGFNEQEGFKIYTEKENLKSGATWSDEEYANPSLLYWYCLIKSVQRFPETVEMMNTAAELHVLDHYRDRSVTNATVVSLGGGCSHELLAVKAVFKKHFPHVKLRLVSLDYEPLWGKIVEPLGIEFDTIDFNSPIESIKSQLDPYGADFYIMSFVYRTYIKRHHEDFIKYLCKSSFGIFINDRNNEYLSFGMMTYKLSQSGYLTLLSDQFEGYPYVKALTESGKKFPTQIYKDTPWVKPSNAIRTSGDRKTPGGDRNRRDGNHTRNR